MLSPSPAAMEAVDGDAHERVRDHLKSRAAVKIMPTVASDSPTTSA